MITRKPNRSIPMDGVCRLRAQVPSQQGFEESRARFLLLPIFDIDLSLSYLFPITGSRWQHPRKIAGVGSRVPSVVVVQIKIPCAISYRKQKKPRTLSESVPGLTLI